MELIEEFELLRQLADRAGLLQTEILYRKSDGMPSMKLKQKNGEFIKEEKPIKSIHFVELTSLLILRVCKSRKERKGHLEALLKLIEEHKLENIKQIFDEMIGIEKGKNIHWRTYDKVNPSYVGFASYLQKMKEEALVSTLVDRPSVGDDNLLLSGWETEVSQLYPESA